MEEKNLNSSSEETRQKIVSTFARWAAASATRQGAKVRGRDWYPAISEIDMETLLSFEPPSQESFAKWHQREVEKLKDRSGDCIGWAAKVLNMVTKVEVYLTHPERRDLAELIHPPIDNTLINAVISKYCPKGGDETSREIRKLCSLGKPINSVKTYSQYSDVIKGLRIVADLRNCSLFEVESFFDG
jgi:hypothetical protein